MIITTLDAAFWKALILMLADKLVIGVIIAGVVYFAQKRLEAFRGEQSLQNDIAKERVQSLPNGWRRSARSKAQSRIIFLRQP